VSAVSAKSILVIGAAESCLGMIKAIQRKGHEALVVGTSSDQPGFGLANASLLCNDGDIEKVVEFAIHHQAAGIVPTPVDRTLAWQAEVAKRLNLIFIPPERIPNFRHKYTQKQALKRAGIPCAEGYLWQGSKAWEYEAEKLGYPLVCKPIDGYASRGVCKCDNKADLEKFITEARAFSSDGSVILEEFMEGKEFNAEGVCFQGRPYVYALVEKISDPFPYTVEMGHIIPPAISEEDKAQLGNLASKAARALGLENGAFNIELKLEKGEARIVEVNGRLAGDFIISHLLKPSTGLDMEEAVVDIALGREPVFEHNKPDNCGIVRFFNLPAGKRIIKVPDLEATIRQRNLIWAKSFYAVGDLVPAVTHMGQRSGFVILMAPNREAMFRATDDAIREIVAGFELA